MTRTASRAQMLHDIFTTAIESGIHYWAYREQYHWQKEATEIAPGSEDWVSDLDGFYAEIRELNETETGYSPVVLRVDKSTIELGIARLLDGSVRVNKAILGAVALANATNEADIDAEAADCIVQAGLFNQLIYG